MILLLLAALLEDPPAPNPLVTAAPVEEVRQKVVEAIRNCPKSADGEIIVCSKDRGIAESYRLPKLDPRFAEQDPKLQRDLPGAGAGDGGFGSCGAVGAAAGTGCAKRDYNAWADWKRRLRDQKRAAEGGQ